MKELSAAFEKYFAEGNFNAAGSTLKQMQQQDPNSVQVKIYTANFYRVTGHPERAEAIYRSILRTESQTKLLSQARQGLKIIEDTEIKQQKDAIAKALAQPGNNSWGYLAIQPMEDVDRKAIAEKIARIFHIDTYTAKTLIPTRNLKILRIGKVGELSVYGSQLKAVGIPALWISLEAIDQIKVYTVNYFSDQLEEIQQQVTGNGRLAPTNTAKEQILAVHDEGELSFSWDEVSCRISTWLPTFGEIVTVNAKHQLVRKEQELDRINICDLHLPKYNCILRFHDNNYRFEKGIPLEVERSLKHIAPTVRQRWESLRQWLERSLADVSLKDEFVPFAEGALQFPEFLKELPPHLDLDRKKESLWDNCFQLYSGTIFLANTK